MAEVVLRDVTKTFERGVVGVEGLNFKVKDREFVVLVGPSGCGKSTTLRLIAGLEELTRGEIHIEGKLVNDVPPKERDIAMVFQNYALYPHMTVYQNLSFGLRLRKCPKREIDERVRYAAVILGIEDLLDRKPKSLSGGQRQRVAVGRALVRKPKVFLFDKPLSNLDAKLRVQMRAELSKLHRRLKATMIYVTHDQTEAMTMGERIVVLRDGRVQQIADPLSLYNSPRNTFVAGFIGSPPMNFLKGVLRAKGVFQASGFSLRVPDKLSSDLAPYEKKGIVLGVRPEDVWIEKKSRDGMISANVEVVEPMGNEILLHLRVRDDLLTSRLSVGRSFPLGQSVSLSFNLDRLHFFNPHTEEAIGRFPEQG